MIVYKIFLEDGTFIGTYPERRKRLLTQQDIKRGIETALSYFQPFAGDRKLKFVVKEYKEG